MTESQQHLFANLLLKQAQQIALTSSEPEDRSAATAAILVEALILATPEMSDYARSTLFN